MMDCSFKGNKTILCLNDDCLEEICKYLELRDRLNFADVSQRFRGIAQICFKLESKVLDCSILKALTTLEIKNYLELTGMFYQECRISKMRGKTMKLLANVINCCPNVKRMRFARTDIIEWKNVFEHMNTLTELEFVGVYLGNEALSLVTKLSKLEALTLTNCELNDATGNIHKLTNLKKFNIHNGEVANINFTTIFQSLRELEELNVKNVYCEIRFSGIAEKCPKLHTLRIQCNNRCFDCECIAELPNLRDLALKDCNPRPTASLLSALADNRKNTLEYLHISEGVSGILPTLGKTWTQIMQHIGSFKKLKQLILCIDPINNDCLQQLGTLENLEEFGLLLDFEVTNDKLFDFLYKCAKLKRIMIKHCRNINNEFINQVLDLQTRRQQKLIITIALVHNDLQEIDDSEYLKLNIKWRRPR